MVSWINPPRCQEWLQSRMLSEWENETSHIGQIAPASPWHIHVNVRDQLLQNISIPSVT